MSEAERDKLRVKYNQARIASLEKEIKSNIDFSGVSQVLDVGCGNGSVGSLFLSKADCVTFLDQTCTLPPKLLVNPKVRFILNDMERGFSPFLAQYDLVTASMLLHHIGDTAAFIRRLAAHVRRGGALVLSDLVTEDGSFHPPGIAYVHRGFDPDVVARECRDAGATRVSVSVPHVLEKPSYTTGAMAAYPVFVVCAWFARD